MHAAAVLASQGRGLEGGGALRRKKVGGAPAIHLNLGLAFQLEAEIPQQLMCSDIPRTMTVFWSVDCLSWITCRAREIACDQVDYSANADEDIGTIWLFGTPCWTMLDLDSCCMLRRRVQGTG